jgi:hypothetical protein
VAAPAKGGQSSPRRIIPRPGKRAILRTTTTGPVGKGGTHMSEQVPEQGDRAGVSRRRMLKRIGAGAAVAWTAPILTSIRTPAFAQYNLCAGSDECPGQDWSCGAPIQECGVPVPGFICVCDTNSEGQKLCWNDYFCSDPRAHACSSSADCTDPIYSQCASTCCGTTCVPCCGQMSRVRQRTGKRASGR